MTGNEVGEYYDSIADDYDALRFTKAYSRQVDKYERSYVLEKVKPGTSVLEIGAGTGRFTGELVKTASSVTAVDVSERMIERLLGKINSPNLTTRHMDAFHIETLPDYGEFDTVVCMRVLPHLEDPIPALNKMCDAVRESGNVVFDFWNPRSFIGAFRKFLRRPSHVLTRFYTYRQMLQIVEASGLIVNDMVAWGYPRIGRFSLDRPGNLISKSLGYSVIFNALRKGSSDLLGNP